LFYKILNVLVTLITVKSTIVTIGVGYSLTQGHQ